MNDGTIAMKVNAQDLTQDEMILPLSHSNVDEAAEPFMFRGQNVSVEGFPGDQEGQEWDLKVHQDPPGES
jgi:hypothetical protein